MNIRLIIFDFDGTLGDTRRNIVTTMQMTIAELGLPSRSDAECVSTIGLPLYGCFETLYPDTDNRVIQKCTDTYRRIFQENLQTIKPQTFPKVVETLSALKEHGLSLAIASSRSHASLVELTQDLGISSIISYLIGADDVEKAKPNPEPVLNVLAAFGYEANETLVVGDMNVDILMGVNAGTKTCGVTYGNGTKKELEEAGADHIIDSIDELTEIVEKYNMEKNNNNNAWKVLRSEYLIKRPWLTARRDELELPDGRIVPEYYVLEYPDWVNVIAITKDGRFVMERQYRHALGCTCYELPCGVMEEGETPLEAAKRELAEETGYGNGEWKELMVLSANPSTMTNLAHCFLATGVEKVSEQHLDPTEELSVHLLTREEVLNLLRNNEMMQSLMVAPLLKYLSKEV